MPAGNPDRDDLEGPVVRVSRPDKVLFPDSGITKEEFVSYYRRVASLMLPHVRGRPISMERFPDGLEGERFFQKDVPDYFPDYVERALVASDGGAVKNYALLQNEASIAYMANLVTIPHIWGSRVPALRRPDRLVWDLDPMGVGFDRVKIAAKLLRYLLGDLGLPCYAMVTGSRGMHVVSFLEPHYDVDDVFQFTKGVAQIITRKLPQLFTVTFAKSKRGSKIYVDYHRNGHAQTAVAPYAVRAGQDAPVALPIRWEEVDDERLRPDSFPLRRVLDRLDRQGDSWGKPERVADLEAARRRIGELLDDSQIAGG